MANLLDLISKRVSHTKNENQKGRSYNNGSGSKNSFMDQAGGLTKFERELLELAKNKTNDVIKDKTQNISENVHLESKENKSVIKEKKAKPTNSPKNAK